MLWSYIKVPVNTKDVRTSSLLFLIFDTFDLVTVVVDLDVLFVNKVRKHLIFAFFRVKIIKR